MAIEKVELVQECFTKHLRMETIRMKEDKETEQEGMQKRMKMERKVGTK